MKFGLADGSSKGDTFRRGGCPSALRGLVELGADWPTVAALCARSGDLLSGEVAWALATSGLMSGDDLAGHPLIEALVLEVAEHSRSLSGHECVRWLWAFALLLAPAPPLVSLARRAARVGDDSIRESIYPCQARFLCSLEDGLGYRKVPST
eukprot:s6289_g3.t1